MDAGAGRPGGLTTETVEERQARLGSPREIGSISRRRVGVALLLVLALSAGVLLGVVPGSSALGRYPVWDLYALAARIEMAPYVAGCGPGEPDDVHVDLLTGRVIVVGGALDLTDDDLAMVTRRFANTRPVVVRADRVAIGVPALCVTTT